MKIISRYILSLLITLLFLAGCGKMPGNEKLVTVSIEPQKYILEQIVGDRVKVRCLMGNGGNPETYDPTVTHLYNLANSLGYIRMGNIGFEAALLDKIHEANPDLPIFNCSVGITPIVGTHSHGDHAHETVDPHTWTSVKNARIIAANMLAAMEELDPEGAKTYRKNFTRFAAHLDSLDNAVGARLTDLQGQAFFVWHPSLSYLARDYGLRQIVLGSPDLKDITPGQLKASIDSAITSGAKVFFIQKEFDTRQAEVVNAEIGARKVEINPMSERWEEEIMKIVDALDS